MTIIWIIFLSLIAGLLVFFVWFCTKHQERNTNTITMNDVHWINPNMLLSYHNGNRIVRVTGVDYKNNSITIEPQELPQEAQTPTALTKDTPKVTKSTPGVK